MFRLDEPGVSTDTALMLRGSKPYKKLATASNYFDEEHQLPVNALKEDADEGDEGDVGMDQEMAGLDVQLPPLLESQEEDSQENGLSPLEDGELASPPSTDALVAACSLSETQLARLRRKARRLSRALSGRGQGTVSAGTEDAAGGEWGPETRLGDGTRVEGALIANVRASKRYKAQQDLSHQLTSASGSEHIVAALMPGKAAHSRGAPASTISYSDLCAAERVADRARRSLLLEQALAGAGVIETVRHDDLVEDLAPDWALLQRETVATARGGALWLRDSLLALAYNAGPRPLFGTVKSSFLWHRHEEAVYFQVGGL